MPPGQFRRSAVMPGREQPETPTIGPRADFAERLRQLRSGQGLTLRALASRSGYTQASLSAVEQDLDARARRDRKSTRLNSSHQIISYALFCLKKKKTTTQP